MTPADVPQLGVARRVASEAPEDASCRHAGVQVLGDLRAERATAVLAGLALAAGSLAGAPVAHAHHINGTKLCTQKYDHGQGQFFNLASDGIRDARGHRVGRLSLNWRPGTGAGYYAQICAVAIRRTHARRRFTAVRVKRVSDSRWRRDAGRYRFYAGPVIRRIRWSETLRGRATIGRRYCNYWAVLWPPEEFVPSVSTSCP
jgi:hypothetical protein